MSQAMLFRIIGYIWAAFGACWVAFALLRRRPAETAETSNGRILRFAFLAVTFILLLFEHRHIGVVPLIVLALAWSLLAMNWATGRSASSGEFRFYRYVRVLVLAATFALLFARAPAIGFLGVRFIPSTPAFSICGFVATLIGLGIVLWARLHLGKFWSDKVVLQTGHELVNTGPYARMRHPIYSGVLLGVLGTAIMLGEWRGLVAFLLLLVNYAIKAKKEERLLAGEFGPGFDEHISRTGFLLPRLWPAAR